MHFNRMKIPALAVKTFFIIVALFLLYPATGARAAEKYVLFVLDTSASMHGSKISYAKSTILQAVRNKPAGTEIALRVFNQHPEDVDDSCIDSELVLDFGDYGAEEVRKAIDGIKVFRQTPLDRTLLEARHDFFLDDKIHEIILITDGADTCGGDPCYRASLLRKELDVKINVIAVGIDYEDARKSLICIAEKSGGKFYGIDACEDIPGAAFELLGLPASPLAVVLMNSEGQKIPGNIEIYDEYGELAAATPSPLREFSPTLPIGTYSAYAETGGVKKRKHDIAVRKGEQTEITFVFEND